MEDTDSKQLALYRARFNARVDREGPVHPLLSTRCWVWTGARSNRGYPQIMIAGERWYAHRLSWRLHHEDPGTLLVCHRCDRPYCVNPDHLFLGTDLDNKKDMWEKGRHKVPKKERGHLSAAQVAEIRRVYIKRHPTFGGTALAARYGVSPHTIYAVVTGRSHQAATPLSARAELAAEVQKLKAAVLRLEELLQ